MDKLDSKSCQFCGESIKAVAIKCRYCNADLRRAKPKSRESLLLGCIILVAVAVTIIVGGGVIILHKPNPTSAVANKIDPDPAAAKFNERISGHTLFSPMGGSVKFLTDGTAEIRSDYLRLGGVSVGTIAGTWRIVESKEWLSPESPELKLQFDWAGSHRVVHYSFLNYKGQDCIIGDSSQKVMPTVLNFAYTRSSSD